MNEDSANQIMHLDPIQRLTRDLKQASVTLAPDEARFLVDAYYQIQDHRKATHLQSLSLSKSNEPHSVLSWLCGQNETLEGQIKRALDAWSDEQPLGRWAKGIVGIGPVLASGLMAHIDIEKAPTVGHIWSFGGLDPNVRWEKGQKRPWNATLKCLFWKCGESFCKVSGNEKDVYGKVYLERKALEQQRNEAGAFADQAAEKLERFKIGKTTDAYAAYSIGKLPPAHIHARAKRYATKLFISHYHHVAYVLRYNTEPPKPYIIEHGGHTHFLAPPNFPATISKSSK